MARYLTTTLPYVNSDPHIGFALEIVEADALARAWRLAGEEVFFNTGTDEHGQKIFEAAQKAGEEVGAYVDRYAKEFEKLKATLDLSNDGFIRTSSPEHIAAAQVMWKRCMDAGDISKKEYEGLYCVGCEAFKSKREIENGHCLIHPNLELQTLKEENYFFAFSKYRDKLLEYLERPGVIIPEWRRQEAIAFVKEGLDDFSISREVSRLPWGIPVPGDPSQVMYVWFDALTSYISTLGWPKPGNFEKFWEQGQTLQMAGKDQVRFQSLMWQAMLMSAKIKNTDQIFYHGFVNSDGTKMSKSLGNVISPYELTKKYGTDATRYILLRHVHPTQDTDVTWERMDEWYTANLTNGLGNLVARVMKLAQDHLPGPVAIPEDEKQFSVHISIAIDIFRFDDAMDRIFVLVAAADGAMTSQEPYKTIKSDDPAERRKAQDEIEFLVVKVAHIAAQLQPFMPATAEAIKAAVLANKKPENLFPRL